MSLLLKMVFVTTLLAFLAWNRGYDLAWFLSLVSDPRGNKRIRYRSGIQRIGQLRDQLKKELEMTGRVNLIAVNKKRIRIEELVGEYGLEEDVAATKITAEAKVYAGRLALKHAADEGERSRAQVERIVGKKSLTLVPAPERAVIQNNSGQVVALDLDRPFDVATRNRLRSSR